MIRRLAAAVALLLAVPATAAAAPTLDALRPCYASAGALESQRESVEITGSGFTPEAHLQVLVDGVVVPNLTAQADVFGRLSGLQIAAPYQPRGERPFTVTVREIETGLAAATTSRVTNLSVSLRPRIARPSRRVRYSGRGFMEPAPIYAHYLFAGRERRTVRLVRRPTGPCGTFSVRRRQIPVPRPRTGQWLVQIDQQREYADPPPTNWVHVLIDVRRRFRDPD